MFQPMGNVLIELCSQLDADIQNGAGETQKPATFRGNLEIPLLLNPFGEIDPGQHLSFSDIGRIEARD